MSMRPRHRQQRLTASARASSSIAATMSSKRKRCRLNARLFRSAIPSTEYQIKAPTKSSDRVCNKLTVIADAASEFESKAQHARQIESARP